MQYKMFLLSIVVMTLTACEAEPRATPNLPGTYVFDIEATIKNLLASKSITPKALSGTREVLAGYRLVLKSDLTYDSESIRFTETADGKRTEERDLTSGTWTINDNTVTVNQSHPIVLDRLLTGSHTDGMLHLLERGPCKAVRVLKKDGQ